MEDISVLYHKKYDLNPKEFHNEKIPFHSFSFRLSSRLKNKNIHTVEDLLNTSEKKLRKIKGMGNGCFNELNSYMESLHSVDNKNNIPKELDPYLMNILNNDFSFVEDCNFNEESLICINHFKLAFDVVDSELIEKILKKDSTISCLIEVLNNFAKIYERKNEYEKIIYSLPKGRENCNVDTLIEMYSQNSEIIDYLKKCKKEEEYTLNEYVYSNIDLIIAKDKQLSKFIKWCNFESKKEIKQFFKEVLKKDNYYRIIDMRANNITLENIGNEIGVTRERVRQIENKIFNKFKEWEENNNTLQKIFIESNENSFLKTVDIEKYLGKFGKIYIYFMKTKAAPLGKCHYDSSLDMFFISNDDIEGSIKKHVDELPDIFDELSYRKYIKNINEDTNFSNKLISLAIKEKYKKTGKLYHCVRLSPSSLYNFVLLNCYPKGIHIYDKEEIDKFKKLVNKKYGIEITQSDRAISSVFSRVGILCGRGIYKFDSDNHISDKLAKDIYEYINNSEQQIFMVNTIFNIFRKELKKEQIENRYYLQGILHKLYGDKWFFNRDYVSKDAQITSINSCIFNFIKESNIPVSKKEIISAYPGITDIIISFVTSDYHIINLFGEYMHIDNFNFSSTDILYFKNTLNDFVSDENIVNCKKIFEYIKMDNPMILKKYYINISYSLFSIFESLFFDKFEFSRPFVAAKGIAIESVYDRVNEMICKYPQTNIKDMLLFTKKNNFQIGNILDFINSFNDSHFLINSSCIASIEHIGLSKELAKKIENIMMEEVDEPAPISSLRCVNKFPRINVKWNEWLIYSMINKWGEYLEVATSSHFFRNAIPIISKIGNMDVTNYINYSISDVDSLVEADDLDKIDDLLTDIIIDEARNDDDL